MVDIIRLSEPEEFQNPFGYLVDLTGIRFSDNNNQTWIQAMPIGTWHHPVHGPIENTFERSVRFADNVNNKVRAIDLDVDYEHKEGEFKAAGWIKQARADAKTGLWLLVEWTKQAAQMIRDKEFRYFSPEFVDEWVDPRSKNKFRDVLFGGGLTNRPFLKGILPINLSEMTMVSGGNMNRATLEKLAKSHGIEFDDSTSDEDLSTKVEDAVIAAEESDDGDSTSDADETEKEPVMASELVTLAEQTPALKKLLTEHSAVVKRLELVEAANRLAETSVRLSELNSGKVVLTPVATQKLSDLMLNPTADGAYEFAKAVLNKGTIELGERGFASDDSHETSHTFQDEVKKLTEGEKGMDYIDAVEKVSRENPDLWEQHRLATFAGEA